jgi:hypothetical protein
MIPGHDGRYEAAAGNWVCRRIDRVTDVDEVEMPPRSPASD